ncbi:MAG: VOC family protein [Chloroflexota bacterium]
MLKLQHCSLVVTDLDKAKAFYIDYLGMEEIPRSPTFTFAGAWLISEGTEIHMILEKDTTAPAGFAPAGVGEQTGLATHFAFLVDNVYEMAERAQTMGVSIVGGPMLRGDGILQLYLHDPDQYLIELFQRVESNEGATERAPVPG